MPLTLKGTQQGILLKLHTKDWEEIVIALKNALDNAEAFFRGGRVIVESSIQVLSEEKVVALRTLLEQYEMELWAILSEDESTIRIARAYGLRTRLPGAKTSQAETDTTPEGNALLVQRTFRSGQSLKYPGHIIILGDVNAGAEIIAGGNIVVWGKVRGLVHAGAMGNKSAIICALDLAPSQLRIAGYISRTPDERRRKPKPELAKVDEDHIIAQPWTTRG